MHEDEAGDLLVPLAVGTCTAHLEQKIRMHSQLISAVGGQMIGNIHSKMEVTPTVETSILTIDVNPRLIVDSTEIEMCPLTSPVRRDIERGREPRVTHPAALNA